MDELAVRKEGIWNNKMVTDGHGNSLHWKRWEQAGITIIHNICHEREDRLLAHEEIRDLYGVPCTFLEMLRLRMGVPAHWRSLLTANFEAEPIQNPEISLPSGKIISILAAPAKKLYTELILAGKPIPTAQRKWDLSVNVTNTEEWNSIYSRPFGVSREMHSLQYHILHRIITCNGLLHRWRIKEDPHCGYCDSEDTLEHFFYTCPISRSFRTQVEAWLRAGTNISLSNITLKEFLMGVSAEHRQASVINLVLLWARYFIHRQKLFGGGNLNLQSWVRELRLKLLMEKRICALEGRSDKFRRWRALLSCTVMDQPGGVSVPSLT